MRQALIVYGLILAVLLAALGLSYVGFRYSREVSASERNRRVRDMAAIAREKVMGIQDVLIRAETEMFDGVSPGKLAELPALLEHSPLASVVVLDLDGDVVAGGFYTKRETDEETEAFKTLLLSQVVHDLELPRVGINQRRHLHRSFDGVPYLFACTRRFIDGQLFFIVVEADLGYLIAAVFPQYLDVKSDHLYQVVDERGELVYGYRFTAAERAEVPFGADTLSSWRLLVAPRDASLASTESRQRTIDLVLIGLALTVIVAGLGVVVLAVRRERRVSQLKSEFISNVSHELKTPLSIISMFGELLAMGRVKSPEQAREYADIIRRESVRLSRLIDSVLDFSKIERGVDVYEFADDQDLREVVERALEISRHRLEQAGMALEVDLSPEVAPLRMDGNAMTLAVLNLVDNALKYAATGKHLRVALRPRDGGIELEVADRGPGVPEDEWDAVLERFYRSRTVRLMPIRGSGIGLALVKHIAEAHGGKIVVDDNEGGGARFRLWIPTTGRA